MKWTIYWYKVSQVSLTNFIVLREQYMNSLRLFLYISPSSINKDPIFPRKCIKEGFLPFPRFGWRYRYSMELWPPPQSSIPCGLLFPIVCEITPRLRLPIIPIKSRLYLSVFSANFTINPINLHRTDFSQMATEFIPIYLLILR